MANGREDPLVGYHFGVDIQGVITGYFTECSGLGSEHEVIEHKVVNESGQEVVLKLPGRLKWENVTLKRGITSSMDIWDWRKQVEESGLSAGDLFEALVQALQLQMLAKEDE